MLDQNIFKFSLGSLVQTKPDGLKGIIISRTEHFSGKNTYRLDAPGFSSEVDCHEMRLVLIQKDVLTIEEMD